METTTKKPALYWSERGQIGCAVPGHAPYRGTDTWLWECWKKITSRETAAFERDLGKPIACETCEAIARNPRSWAPTVPPTLSYQSRSRGGQIC